MLGRVTDAKKALEWQHVADSVNAVASEGRSEKKVIRRKSGSKKAPGVTQAERLCDGGGTGQPELTCWMNNWRGPSGNPS